MWATNFTNSLSSLGSPGHSPGCVEKDDKTRTHPMQPKNNIDGLFLHLRSMKATAAAQASTVAEVGAMAQGVAHLQGTVHPPTMKW